MAGIEGKPHVIHGNRLNIFQFLPFIQSMIGTSIQKAMMSQSMGLSIQ
ncbi:MAG: hypothetical protein HRT90_03865 [Candidatus Margulisbacteria bacterium]|nr:hypothetical protein [Candidatus Margulisiibacteriota bacterium]